MLSLTLKRRLDTLVGVPALAVIGALARIAGLLLNRDHHRDPVNTILILKFQGIGSLALALPSILSLRAEYPKARFIFWGSSSTAAMARTVSIWDEVHVLNDRSLLAAAASVFITVRALIRQRIDWAYDLEVYSKLSSILLTLSCARNRAGFATSAVPGRSYIHTTLIYFNRYRHVGDSYRNLLQSAAQTQLPAATNIPWAFNISKSIPALRAQLDTKLAKYCVVNVNVGELAGERAWPEEKYLELLRTLEKRDPDLMIILVGKGKAEAERNARLAALTKALDLTDAVDLQDLIRVLNGAEFVVSGDTGVLHLANLCERPCIAIFGPTLEQTYFKPRHSQSQAVSNSVFCRPCIHHFAVPPCHGDNICMKSISVDAVLSAIDSTKPPAREHDAEKKETYKPGTPSTGVIYQRPIL